MTKLIGWIITAFVVLFIAFVALIALNLGFGVLSLTGSLVGSLFSLVFSKGFITLLAIGLVAYLLWERAQERKQRRRYWNHEPY